VSDLFAERFAAVRQRFAAKLDARIDEIEATVPELDREGSQETLARAHRSTTGLGVPAEQRSAYSNKYVDSKSHSTN
jgi:hypothetical protein